MTNREMRPHSTTVSVWVVESMRQSDGASLSIMRCKVDR
jgi:hypothetical protein